MLVTFVRYCVLFDCQWVSYTCRFYFFVIHVWHPHFSLNQWNKEVLDLTWRVIKLTIRIRKLTTTKTKKCVWCVRACVRVCLSVLFFFSLLLFCSVLWVFRRHCAYTPNQLARQLTLSHPVVFSCSFLVQGFCAFLIWLLCHFLLH